jgi:hypothetical protein
MEKLIRTYHLMTIYWKFKTQQERDWWIKSLLPEDKALVRKELGKTPSKLF